MWLSLRKWSRLGVAHLLLATPRLHLLLIGVFMSLIKPCLAFGAMLSSLFDGRRVLGVNGVGMAFICHIKANFSYNFFTLLNGMD